MLTQKAICIITLDTALRDAAKSAIEAARLGNAIVIDAAITDPVDPAIIESANLVIVDIDATRSEHLLALQRLMIKVAGRAPVIVLTDAFDDVVGRWFLQIRVGDFLRKPMRKDDLMRACIKVLRDAQPVTGTHACVTMFMPACGGVGATTLAIETAMQQLLAGMPAGETVCLVDLDLGGNACAEALDIAPQLDLAEMGGSGERLDGQLLEVMLSRHASGLSLLSAQGRPGESCDVNPAVIGRLLDVVAARFDHLVIDVPRAWAPYTDDILAGADRIFIVTDMTVPGLRAARRLNERIRERGVAASEPKIIVNRFQTGLLFGNGLRRADVERALGVSFAGPVANNYQLVREAIDRGVALESVKSGNNVTTDLKRIIFAAQAA